MHDGGNGLGAGWSGPGMGDGGGTSRDGCNA
jgi:hypothetical protein